MNRAGFFETIRSACSSEREYVIEVLKARGFLLDETSDGLMISDNSAKYDSRELDGLLKQYHLGHVSGDKVIIENTDCAELISTEFGGDYRRNYEAGYSTWRDKWTYFKSREHGCKVSALTLEPFIARYIKALSACGVLTWCSCDGDHQGRRGSQMIVEMEGDGSTLWHKLICDTCIGRSFNIKFKFDRDVMLIRLSDKTKFLTYYKLNRAAEFLYANRQTLREIKRAVMMDMSGSCLRHCSSEEIGREFEARASELLDRGMPIISVTEIDPIS